MNDQDGELKEVGYKATEILDYSSLNIGWNENKMKWIVKVIIPVAVFLILIVVYYMWKARNLKMRLENELEVTQSSSSATFGNVIEPISERI